MSQERRARFAPLSGALFVILELAGVIVGGAGGRAMVTLGDSTTKIVRAYAHPVGSAVWVGAYLELASLAAFAAFALWLFHSRPGALGRACVLTATVYVGVTIVALIVGDVLEYRAGHGLGAQQTLALFDLQAALYASTWGIAGAFLLLAPVEGWMRRAAVPIAVLGIVGMAFPKAAPGQFSVLLFLLWTLVASVALTLRRSPAPAGAAAIAGASRGGQLA